MPNLSKKRFFPDNMYDVYRLPKSKRGDFLNTWFDGKKLYNKNLLVRDEVWTLKQVDKETSRFLYHYDYNPVSISILASNLNKKGTVHQMKCQIHSIDDSSFGIWFDANTIEYFKEKRLLLMEYIQNVKKLNGTDFINKCIEIGANPTTKDFN